MGYAIKFLSYFEWVPIIGPYISRLRKVNLKKSDDENKV